MDKFRDFFSPNRLKNFAIFSGNWLINFVIFFMKPMVKISHLFPWDWQKNFVFFSAASWWILQFFFMRLINIVPAADWWILHYFPYNKMTRFTISPFATDYQILHFHPEPDWPNSCLPPMSEWKISRFLTVTYWRIARFFLRMIGKCCNIFSQPTDEFWDSIFATDKRNSRFFLSA